MTGIKLLTGFRGRETSEQYWPAGSYQDVDEALAIDLISRKVAKFSAPPAVIAEPELEQEPELEEQTPVFNATDGAIKAAEAAGIGLLELFPEGWTERLTKPEVDKRIKEMESPEAE